MKTTFCVFLVLAIATVLTSAAPADNQVQLIDQPMLVDANTDTRFLAWGGTKPTYATVAANPTKFNNKVAVINSLINAINSQLTLLGAFTG